MDQEPKPDESTTPLSLVDESTQSSGDAQSPQEQTQNQSRKLSLTIVASGFVIVLLTVGFWLYRTTPSAAPDPLQDTSQTSTSIEAEELIEEPDVLDSLPQDWTTYTDTSAGFAFSYPRDWGDFTTTDAEPIQVPAWAGGPANINPIAAVTLPSADLTVTVYQNTYYPFLPAYWSEQAPYWFDMDGTPLETTDIPEAEELPSGLILYDLAHGGIGGVERVLIAIDESADRMYVFQVSLLGQIGKMPYDEEALSYNGYTIEEARLLDDIDNQLEGIVHTLEADTE